MKKMISVILMILIFTLTILPIYAEKEEKNAAVTNNEYLEDTTVSLTNDEVTVNAKSALLMEATTGTVLFEKDADIGLSPASVTKIMTLLIVMEALEDHRIDWNDKVTISENAASMGGSQVFLEEGETFSVEELVKCTVIASANDAAVALAEHVCGSEESFVHSMNERAVSLGLSASHFENVTGLDDTVVNHVMSARDIAVISRELLKYPKLFTYSSIWQDTIRDGEFTLTNTNRLVRFYDGCTGLKTGSTDTAGFCVTVTAERNGLSLISVIMGAESRDERNNQARKLLDYGFSHYEVFKMPRERLEQVPVYGGIQEKADIFNEEYVVLVPKGKAKKVEIQYQLPETLSAPLAKGDRVGELIFILDGEEIGKCGVFVDETVEENTYFQIFVKILTDVFYKRNVKTG